MTEDGGSLSANGNRMGSDRPDTGPRHRVLARAIAELIADHDRTVEHTRTLQRSLRAHTPTRMAEAFAGAVSRVAAGTRVSTRQGPHGRLLTAPDARCPDSAAPQPTNVV
ncbi:hypothetical protein [Nocardiopsis sp. FIRDI 009]|uniref:hypothetical protein n=1 Tax=Nocardiopsis sp. FIRDI 009 TaxID=714197 RepID=UPI000E270E8E|nr:hypothetical protein [Nocardiopsis sp. FIRDI 009]